MTERNRSRLARTPSVVLVLLLLVVGAAVGGASALLRGATYTSQAQLSYNPSVRSQLDPNYNAPDSTTFDREVADQADVILSDAVVSKVVATIGLTASQVRSRLDVGTTAGRSEILISGSGETPAAAQRLTRSATDAYVATLQARNATLLDQRIAALKPVIAELRRQLTGLGSNAEGGALADDIASLQSQQAGYTVAKASVPVEVAVQRGAELPDGPSSLSPFVTGLIGGVLGVVLGVCLVLLRATRRRDENVPDRVDATRPDPVTPVVAAATPARSDVTSLPAPAAETPARRGDGTVRPVSVGRVPRGLRTAAAMRAAAAAMPHVPRSNGGASGADGRDGAAGRDGGPGAGSAASAVSN